MLEDPAMDPIVCAAIAKIALNTLLVWKDETRVFVIISCRSWDEIR